MGYARFVRSTVDMASDPELAFVDAMAQQLVKHLASSASRIDTAHVHQASSMAIQTIVAQLLRIDLHFTEEVILTPSEGFVTRARPDFFYRLPGGQGILAEVERGGTTTNNHDLKDLWKAHIAPDAQHLFLVVPNSNWNAAGKARERPFHRVVNRLEAFFGEPRREVDISSLHVFGYGRAD